MTDLISRQDAIALLASLKREKPLDWFDGDYSNGIGDCIEALTNMPSADSRWQPIETAPKDGRPVLLFARCQHATASGIVVGWHLEDRGWIELSFTSPVGIVPSHWMPLPEPPK